jgi:sugar phosphate isomerase/epimerase
MSKEAVMSRKNYTLLFHHSNLGEANIATLLDAAKEAGFDGVEASEYQLKRYLNAGYSIGDLKKLSEDMPILSTGYILDCERGGYEFTRLMKECEFLFDVSSQLGAEAVQILTGPADFRAVECFQQGLPFNGYMALQGLELKEQEEITVRNMKEIGKLAHRFGINIYFEPLCWTPVGSIRQGVQICEKTGLDNVKMVIDFFHGFIAGDSPDYIATLDPSVIEEVHVCDTRKAEGVPNEAVIRNVALGEGDVPVGEWIDAVKATGFSGKWMYETFYLKDREQLPKDTAKKVYRKMTELIG